MALRRSRINLFLAPAIILGALLLVALTASQIEQHVFRRRAELLLTQIQSVELRKTTWSEAQLQFDKWGARRTFSKSCDAQRCSFELTLEDPVYRFLWQRNFFVKLDDYFRWKLNLHYDTAPFMSLELALLNYYLRSGGHPAKVTASIEMRNEVVWAKSFEVNIETYGHPAYWSSPEFRLEFPLLVRLYSVPRFQYPDGRDISSQLYLHPDYEIGRPGGCTICVLGWVRFTPYADPTEVRRIMQLDLSCLTRWHPCVSQAEIMPAAWNQYESELSKPESEKSVLVCSRSMLQVMGRDSTDIAAVRVIGSHKDEDGTMVSASVLERLKGSSLKVGDTVQWTVWPRGQNTSLSLPKTGPMLLFLGLNAHIPRISPPLTCEGLSADENALNQIRRGIAKDYAPTERTYPL